MQLAAAFEISNHYYVGNFELQDIPKDFVNGVYHFFYIAATYLNALGLRNKSVPFCRFPSFVGNCSGGFLNLLVMLFDLFMVVGIFITLPIYFSAGRLVTRSIISGFAAIAGVGILFRLWRNLGPSRGTLLGGIFYFFFAILGVVMEVVCLSTGVEWVHALIEGCFLASLIPFTCAILCAVEVDSKQTEEGDGDDGEIDGVELTSVPL